MNAWFFVSLWSYKNELKYIAVAFLAVLLVPVMGVILLTRIGVNVISDTLVSVDEVTNAIEIKDPASGEVVKTIYPYVVWPVTGKITLEFGKSSLYQPFHTGLDIANPQGKVGDTIRPAMNGTVTYAGEIFWGYGKHVIIDHGDDITTTYAHLNKIYVYRGQVVSTTDPIGTMGNTGWSTGPHLHFETRIYGIPVNPRVFLKN